MGDLEGVPGGLFWPRQAPTVVAIWKVSQCMNDPFLSCCTFQAGENKHYFLLKRYTVKEKKYSTVGFGDWQMAVQQTNNSDSERALRCDWAVCRMSETQS